MRPTLADTARPGWWRHERAALTAAAAAAKRQRLPGRADDPGRRRAAAAGPLRADIRQLRSSRHVDGPDRLDAADRVPGRRGGRRSADPEGGQIGLSAHWRMSDSQAPWRDGCLTMSA